MSAAFAVAALGIAISCAAFRFSRNSEDAEARLRFEQRAAETAAGVQERLRDYRQVLTGAAAILSISGAPDGRQWHDYVASLHIDDAYPGILGIGFVPLVPAAGVPALEASARSEGLAGFQVWPQGDRPAYAPVRYLEPVNVRNRRALGYDVLSDAVRRQALEQARDRGTPVLTGPVRLVQEDQQEPQAGAVLYVPVYRRGVPLDSVEQRRAALAGWVSGPFRMGDLMHALIGAAIPGIDVALYDGAAAADHVMFSSAGPGAVIPWAERDVAFDVDGRTWLLRLAAAPAFAGRSDQAPLILGAGILISLLLAAVIAAFGRSERRARAMAQDMTQALREAEGQQRAIVEGSADGIITIDAQGVVRTINPAAERMFGYAAADIIGQDIALLIPEALPGDRTTLAATLGERGAAGLQREVFGRRRDGSEFTAHLALNLVSRLGRSDFIATVGDISERKRSQQALEASEQRYRTVVESLQEGLLLIDGDGAVVACNPAAERILGVPLARMRDMWNGDPGWRMLGEDCSNNALALDNPVHRVLDGGQAQADIVVGVQSPAGSARWLSINTALIPDADGAGRGAVASFSDITERKRAEWSLAEANRLREAILDNAPFAIISTDAAGIIRSMNPAAERLLRYRRDELVGRARWETLHVAEEIGARSEELSLETGRPVEPGFEALVAKAREGVTEEREWTFVRKDGSRVPVQLAVSALRDASGGVSGFFGISYDITERKRREEYTRHIAHHDHLTGLPNRVLLHDRLQMATDRARRDAAHVGVLLIDLDQFKRINDSLGHQVGDELLWIVADRLRGCVRAGDTVARMGGDEFVVLLPDVSAPESIRRVAQTIVERVAAPAVVGPHELHVTPSVGVSVFPGDGEDVYSLLKHADMAMYQAKAAGRRCYRVFSRAMERAAAERLELEGALRRAMQRDEFVLHYQPQVCLNTGRVIGMEALLRWNSPTTGPVSPHAFVPVAEETGLILPLGEWVLRTACHAARRLHERNGAPIRLAVNLSPRQFRQGNLESLVEQALIDSGLDPAHLELEITEGVLMDHTEETVERLQRLRRLGVSIAVDDFGTGYSSLSYIARFPIDTLKIDRSFVSKLPESTGDAAVAPAIVALAHSLNIKVVAEGVENEEQCAFLRVRRCDAGQGFFFGKGVPLEEFSMQPYRLTAAQPAEPAAAPPVTAEALQRKAG
ncbi:MAG: EAL domain-containing protein [Nevskia sp.]|nr:EAL domain-containing protein [Nevskia sp.]